MRYSCLLQTVAAIALLAAPALAQQNRDDELEQLRRRLQELEQQNRDDAAARRRPVEIGARARMVEPQTIVRIYDLGDLFVIAPSYEAQRLSDLMSATAPLIVQPQAVREPAATVGGFGGGGFGGGGGGFFSIGGTSRALPDAHARTLHQAAGAAAGEPANRLSLDSLIDAIQQTIAPETWSARDGGKITTLGTSLIISAEDSVHQQIEALIAQLRERWGTMRTVTVQADWVWLTGDELTELTQNGAIDRARLREAMARPMAEAQRPAGYSANITCYNGQTVHVVAGGQSLAVTGIMPTVGAGAVGYQPLVSMIQEGAVLQVTPTASSSGKYVVLDVHSRVNLIRQRGAGEKPVAVAVQATEEQGEAAAQQTIEAAIDRPQLMNQRLSTTLRLPVGRPVLVGGMTFESKPAPGDPNLYLFVEATVQELKDEAAANADAG